MLCPSARCGRLWYDPPVCVGGFRGDKCCICCVRVRGVWRVCWRRCCWTSTIAPLGAQAPEPAAQQTPARHAGGEANLILPDLGSVDFQGYNGRTLLTVGLFGVAARTGLRHGHLRAAAQPAGASIDARDLRADLRNLQDLPDHAGQVHPAPRAVHRRDHGLLLRRAAALRRVEGRDHPALQPDRHRRQLRRRLVRHPRQHLRELARRVRRPARASRTRSTPSRSAPA